MATAACSLIVDEKLEQNGTDAAVPLDHKVIPEPEIEPPPPPKPELTVTVLEPKPPPGELVPHVFPGDDVTVEVSLSMAEPVAQGTGAEAQGLVAGTYILTVEGEGIEPFVFYQGTENPVTRALGTADARIPPPGAYALVARLMEGDELTGAAPINVCSRELYPEELPGCLQFMPLPQPVPEICAPQDDGCLAPCTSAGIECPSGCPRRRSCPGSNTQPCVAFESITPVVVPLGQPITVQVIVDNFVLEGPSSPPDGFLRLAIENMDGVPVGPAYEGPETVVRLQPTDLFTGLYILRASLFSAESEVSDTAVSEACWPIFVEGGGLQPSAEPDSRS